MRALLTSFIAVGLTGCITLSPQPQVADPVGIVRGVEWRSGDWRHCDVPHCQQPTPKTLLLLPEQPKPQPARAVELPSIPAAPPPKPAPPEPVVVSFPFASATPTQEGMEAIRIAVERFNGMAALRIEGHTDSVGAQKANDVMAAARARRVARELKRLGLRARIEIQSGGKCCYAATNDTKAGRAANRRVEIHPATISKESQ
jgi:outer membrane protein OmpA-like peptidoglycan-associated protein